MLENNITGNFYGCLSKTHFSSNLLWYSYPVLQGFNYILSRWVPQDKYMQKVALRVFRIINVLINLTFNLQTSVLHLLFFSFKYLSHLDECPAETGGKSNTWRRLTLDGMYLSLGSFCRYRGTDYVQQTKQYNQTVKPPGELYCLVPLFLQKDPNFEIGFVPTDHHIKCLC